jgi:hypothetical protein
METLAYTATAMGEISNMSISQLDAALFTNLTVYRCDSACTDYLKVAKPTRAKILKLKKLSKDKMNFMAPYDTMNLKSNYFRKSFKTLTGRISIKTSATRWYGDIDATANLKVPLEDGSLVLVIEDMVARELCEKSAGKALCVLRNVRKLTVIKVEVSVVRIIGLAIKVAGQ